MRIPFELPVQVVSLIAAFILTLITGIILIPAIRRLKFGQTVRSDGPPTHLKKTGTPTMGGLLFIIPLVILSFFYAGKYAQVIPLTFVTVGFGAIGFIDDFLKVIRKHKDGLNPKQKMLGLLVISTIFTLYAAYYSDTGTNIIIPFGGVHSEIALPVWFFIPFTIFVLISITNAVNITDGLDGLAAGITLIVMVFFTLVAMTRNEWDYIRVFSSIVAGGCLGFLAFNSYPARIIMGDTGALALGGAVGAIAVMTGIPWILLIAGLVYVLETLSVILQVISFKTTGKRIFRMAPLHHHFELIGWKETKVVAVFWTATAVLCLIGLLTLRIRFF